MKLKATMTILTAALGLTISAHANDDVSDLRLKLNQASSTSKPSIRTAM